MCKTVKKYVFSSFLSCLFYRNRKPKLICILTLKTHNKISFIVVVIIARKSDLDDQGFPVSRCAVQCCHAIAQLEHAVDTQVNRKLAVPVDFVCSLMSPTVGTFKFHCGVHDKASQQC